MNKFTPLISLGNHSFLIDAGIWLLSEKAVNSLMQNCGWDHNTQTFSNKVPDTYDLYGSWALSLGAAPLRKDSSIAELTTAVVPLPDTGFYHFGTNNDLIQSLYDIQNLVSDQSRLGIRDMKSNQSIWVENSSIPPLWHLGSRNVLTGIEDNNWDITLPDGVSVDIVPRLWFC